MWLIVGLGNPGSQYQHNRHNIGFMAVDEIVRRHNLSEPKKKFQALVAEGTIGGEKILLLKPQTFMNLSGQSVQAACAFYKIPLDHVVVFHDELDLLSGKIRTKFGGGAAGHNGLRSIDEHLGQDYWRVRLGIGHPGEKEMVTGHVLGDFTTADREWLKKMLMAIADNVDRLVKTDMDGFMSKVSQTMQPPKPSPGLEESSLRFLPFKKAHLELFKKWLGKPHIKEFWQEPGDALQIEDKFIHQLPKRGVHSFVIERNGDIIGYAQYYEAIKIGNGWWLDEKPGTYGIDFMIGEESLIGKGIGTKALKKFIDFLVAKERVRKLIVDPDPVNVRAVKSFKKVGFQEEGEISTPGGRTLLMSKYLKGKKDEDGKSSTN